VTASILAKNAGYRLCGALILSLLAWLAIIWALA